MTASEHGSSPIGLMPDVEIDHLRDIDDGDCFLCGGEGYLSDSCVCESFEDTCCCLEPEPMPCPECARREREAQRSARSAAEESSNSEGVKS